MRILLIHNFYQYFGGEDIYVTNLKKLLEDNGHQVYLYSKDSKNIKTVWDKVKTAIGVFYNPWVEKELTKIIREFKPNVAHFHNLYPLIGATAYRVFKRFNIPIIQHVHNYRFMCPKGTLFRKGKICELCLHKKFPFWAIVFGCYHQSRLASFFLSLSFYFHRLIKTFEMIDKYIFPSEFTRKYYIRHLKIKKEKTFFLPYFVDLPKNLVKKVKKEDYFLFVGRLSEEKGIIELLEVFKTLPKHKLLVIGDGPLMKRVKEYNIYPNIKIIGFLPRKKVYEFIKKSKAVIIPSLWYEVLPLVYIESLANNTPALLLRINIFKKIDNKNLLLKYHQDSFQDLKEKIINISNKAPNKSDIYYLEYKKKYSRNIHFRLIIDQYHSFYENSNKPS